MDDTIRRMKSGISTKTDCPETMDASAFLALALKNSGSASLGDMLVNFYKNMLDGTSDPFRPCPKNSVFLNEVDEVKPRADLIKQSHGINCTNEEHQGSHSNLKMNETCECEFQMKSDHGYWSLNPLKPCLFLAPVFLIVLVSRSSPGEPIPQEKFEQLKEIICKKKEYIWSILKEETGIDYEIHIIEECGIDGSFNGLISDAQHQVRDDAGGLHMAATHIEHLFLYHKTRTSLFGLMMNSPGQLTGKLSNYAHFLKDLQPGGIEPSSVYIMSTGVQMATGERQGVVENFTMFSGKILMERAKLYMQEGEDVEKCTQPTVDGFITGMLAEAESSPRCFRKPCRSCDRKFRPSEKP